jgi:hypothetical protein
MADLNEEHSSTGVFCRVGYTMGTGKKKVSGILLGLLRIIVAPISAFQ